MTREASLPSLLRLRTDALFSGLPDGVLARLLGALDEVQVGPGEALYRHGEPASFLYLLEEGTLDLLTPTGRPIELKERRCGEEAAVTSSYACSAIARTDLRVLRLPKSALTEVAKANPAFAASATQALLSSIGGESFLLPGKA